VAALPPGDPGAQGGKCQGKYSFATATTYMSVRYGLFWRGDIVPTKATYGNENYSGTSTTGGVSLTYANTLVIDRSKRADCASPPNCTYAEEMTNFSNWYAYYHTRIQMMKSAAGQAFATLNNQYRVGFVTINPTASKYIPVDDFYDDSTISYAQRTNWYSTLYSIKPNSSTPLREGLANAGLYFAGLKPGVMTDDPIQYSCQQNFSIVTTDGFWNGTDANVHDLNGHTMGNFDNVNSGASSRSFGAYDGGVAGATDTLADVAMYYYKTDLRTSALGNCPGALNSSPTTGVAEWGVCENNVPMTAADTAAGLVGTQHMVTFTLGLSDGLLTYQPDYATASSGDFYRIKTAATGCSFSGSGTCNWPLPLHDSSTALDDLWHAAVNGRGVFYQARDPVSLSAGLVGALTGIGVHTAAAAASSTSSPNITQTDNYIFSSTYRTGKWDGEVVAQQLDVTTGNVIGSYTVKTSPPCPTPFFGSCTLPYVWSAQAQLDTLVQSDTTPDKSAKRIIYTYDNASVTGNPVKDFLYGSLTAAEQAYFDGHCSTGSALPQLSQCSSGVLSATTEMPLANSGLNLVNWLRGNQSLEPDIYRPREHILGDTVNAKPSFVKFPLYSFSDTVSPTYSAFKAAITSLPRQGVLYMGTNDGMLHAFNSDTGAEMWGYLPKIVMPNLYKLADVAYPNNHQYYVDGSPETMDVFVDSLTATANSLSAGWHTILVGGLGLGGRGYYALDVTDPASPIALWEICSDIVLCPTVGTTVYADPDIGYSYGNPVITKRSTDGKWVVLVTSGYNNVNSGSTSGQGVLFELDALSGEILSKTFTGSGSSANPSGLAKISPWINSFFTNNQTRYVYGGDLNGDVWRFDLGEVGSTGNPTVTQIASVKDAAGVAQSITTRPVLGDPMHNTLDTLSFKAADINKQPKGNPAVFIATGRYVGLSDVGNEQMQTVYAIKDDLSKTGTAAYIGNPRAPNAGFGSFVKQYILQPGGVGTPRTTTTTPVTWSTNQGWYADLALYSGSTSGTPVLTGERVNIDPQLVVGTLIVVSNIPQSSACTTGGTSWLYSFDFLTGQYVASEGNTNVAVYLGNALSVGIVVVSLPSGPLKAIVTSADSTKTTETPTLKGNGSTTRASWRELMQ
jgi:type IV pilus assembly protein PilY1